MSPDGLIHVRYVGNADPNDGTTRIAGSEGEIVLGGDGYLTPIEYARSGRYRLQLLDGSDQHDPSRTIDLTALAGSLAPDPGLVDLTAPAASSVPADPATSLSDVPDVPPPAPAGESTTPETGN